MTHQGVGPDWLEAMGCRTIKLPAPFDLWRIDVSPQDDQRLMACLSGEEHARAAKFRTEALARRYRTAHAALRILGERRCGIPAAQQVYHTNAFGKPCLANVSQAHCSLSYSGESVLVGWSLDHEIGIDLERVRVLDDAAELADLHYTARERAALPCPGSRHYSRAFLTLWVRKEACVKALGQGLNIAPSSFDCDVDPRLALAEIDGSSVESDVYDLKDGILVAWARIIQNNWSDRNRRLAAGQSVTAGVAAALRE
ncbi:hypothetical protein NTCA1_15660 [Novosphingobium sp. TCA1]|nr:hypothetical protein NTCA1_15660 [Novosphingobium sp. TCA1]